MSGNVAIMLAEKAGHYSLTMHVRSSSTTPLQDKHRPLSVLHVILLKHFRNLMMRRLCFRCVPSALCWENEMVNRIFNPMLGQGKEKKEKIAYIYVSDKNYTSVNKCSHPLHFQMKD